MSGRGARVAEARVVGSAEYRVRPVRRGGRRVRLAADTIEDGSRRTVVIASVAPQCADTAGEGLPNPSEGARRLVNP